MNLRKIFLIILGVTTVSTVAYGIYIGVIPLLWAQRAGVIILAFSLAVGCVVILNRVGLFSQIAANRKQILLAILALAIVVAIACGICLSITPWFWIYWLFLAALATALIFCIIRYEAVANHAGNIAGHLRKNNNWRLGALAILAIVFTISAILAGLGRPLLISSAVETKNVVMEQVERHHPDIRSEMNYILKGKMVQPTKVTEKKYSSWWHWIWTIFLWISTIIYLPFAFIDEAKHALKEAIKIVEKRNKHEAIRTGSASTAVPAPASRVVFKDSFMRLFSIDILAEYVPIFVSKIMKRIVNI